MDSDIAKIWLAMATVIPWQVVLEPNRNALAAQARCCPREVFCDFLSLAVE